MVDRLRRLAKTAVLMVLACGLLLGMVGWREWRAREAYLQERATGLANLADLLLQHTEGTVKLADYAVMTTVQRLEMDGTDPDAMTRFGRALAARVDALPGVRGLTIYDRDGMRIAGSVKMDGAVNDADAAFFRHHRADPDRGSFTGDLIRSRNGDAWVFTVSRRYDNPDGSFAGVAVARLDADYFARHFAAYNLGYGGSIGLATTTGHLIARYPATAPSAPVDMSTGPLFAEVRARSFGTFQATSRLDGEFRITAFRRSDVAPLVVWVSSTTAGATQQWAMDAKGHLLTTAVLIGLVAALGLYLVRQVRRAQASEAAMRQSEVQYRLLAETTTDVIVRLDLDLRRTYASPACRTIYGMEPEEMLEAAPLDGLHPESSEETVHALRRLVHGEAERFQESLQVRRKDGSFVWVEASCALLRNAETGLPDGIIAAVRDISDRRAQTAKLSQANEDLERLSRHLASARDQADRASLAKSRFLANMSHELRTPLNGVLGYAYLLRLDGGLSASQEVRVDAMLEAGAHLLDMINEVLDLSAIEQDKVAIQLADMDLGGLIDHCLGLVRPTALAKALSLTAVIDPGVPARVIADQTRVRQIVLNLLGNAVKFTAEGSVELRVRLVSAGLRIEVADTGPGIAAADRSRLFKDFDRLDFAASETIEGSGLGLAISARLAALMGGYLFHEDNPGGGSVFCLDMLFVEATGSDAGLGGGAPAGPSRSLQVLLVDDMALNREVAEAFLQSGGHRAVCAESGKEAVAKAAAADFDVILMDVRMPGMDGLEASRQIRALHGPRGQTPIVALTAQAFFEQVEACSQAGMDAHLSKPFTPEALLEVVARMAEPRADRDQTETSDRVKMLDKTEV